MSVLALIPARAGSQGIPGKNWRQLGGRSLVLRAIDVAVEVGALPVLSTDVYLGDLSREYNISHRLQRPPELAQDDTPMLAVVQHALVQIPGPPDQVIVLLQPTQPLRTPAHVRAAIALLQETQADSVVSVVELPRSHHPIWLCEIDTTGERGHPGAVFPYPGLGDVEGYWFDRPSRRQDLPPIYKPDGTVYAFKREAFERCKSIFGSTVMPLIFSPEESCELDTEADWTDLERRWALTHAR